MLRVTTNLGSRYLETIKFFYANTRFHFSSYSDIGKFSGSILPHRLNIIRYISMNFEWSANEPALSQTRSAASTAPKFSSAVELLSTMESLKEVKVITNYAVFRGPLNRCQNLAWIIVELKRLAVKGLKVDLVVLNSDLLLWEKRGTALGMGVVLMRAAYGGRKSLEGHERPLLRC